MSSGKPLVHSLAPGWPDTIRVHYEDFGGNVTERSIVVHKVRPHHDTLMITGLCLLRRDIRNFRSDGITSLSDPETGEVFVDVEKKLRSSPWFKPGRWEMDPQDGDAGTQRRASARSGTLPSSSSFWSPQSGCGADLPRFRPTTSRLAFDFGEIGDAVHGRFDAREQPEARGALGRLVGVDLHLVEEGVHGTA